MTAKLFCTYCGSTYYRRDSKDKQGNVNSKWVCSGKINNGTDSCPSFAIYESELKPVLFELFKETAPASEKLIESYIEMYKGLEESGSLVKDIKKLEQKIENEINKKDKLLEHNATGKLSDDDFISMINKGNQNIEEWQKEIFELEEQLNSREEFKKHIDTIRKVLIEAEKDAKDGLISRQFVQQYIDKIYATPDGDEMKLEIKIFTGETTDKYLQKLRFRSGNTSKEIVTEYDFSVASSIEILQTTIDQMANYNFDLLSKYMESGDYYALPKGTRIKLLQTRDDKYVKCLVLDGKQNYIGKEFWTFKLSFEYGSEIPYELIVTK